MERPSNYVALCDMLFNDLRICSRRLGESRRYISSLIDGKDPDFKGSYVKWGRGYALEPSEKIKITIGIKLKEAGLLSVRQNMAQGISAERYLKIVAIPTVDISAALQGIKDSPLWLRR